MTTLPSDILKFELIKHLTVPTFLRYSSTNNSLARLCKNEDIWETFLKRDFPQYEYQGIYPKIIYRLLDYYTKQIKRREEIYIGFFNKCIQFLLKIDPQILKFISVLLTGNIEQMRLYPRNLYIRCWIRSTTLFSINYHIHDSSFIVTFEIMLLELPKSTSEVRLSIRFLDSPVEIYLEVIRSYLKISSYQIITNSEALKQLMQPLASRLSLKEEHPEQVGSKYRWYANNKGRIDIFVPKTKKRNIGDTDFL